MKSNISRREFMVGCTASIAAMYGAQLGSMAFADPNGTSGVDQVMVVVFLRGACDALSVLVPLEGEDRAHYETARPGLKIPARGPGAALPLKGALEGKLGLHPALEPLHELYSAGHLAFVTATGMHSDTRSHFDAQQFMELGIPDAHNTTSGWISRFLQTGPALEGKITFPALSVGGEITASMLSYPNAVAFNDPGDMALSGDAGYQKALWDSLNKLYTGDTWLHQAGQQTLKTLERVRLAGFGEYKAKVAYPESDFGNSLKTISRVLKQGLSLRVATVDFGGWDTHQYQADHEKGYFADHLGELAQSLSAFYTDLEGISSRLTVVVMSEFGRRLEQNASNGTDHGHGSMMMVLGGKVKGGQVYGKWPGLHPEQLYDHADLAVTTDYRTVIAELLSKQMQCSDLKAVFPTLEQKGFLGLLG